MKNSGVYLLLIRLGKDQLIRVGRLGKHKFKRGLYVYVGSAKRGLKARIERHLKRRKRLFWHIDYLLASKHAEIWQVLPISSGQSLECELSRAMSRLPGVRPVRKFGSSDCGCVSHLFYLG